MTRVTDKSLRMLNFDVNPVMMCEARGNGETLDTYKDRGSTSKKNAGIEKLQYPAAKQKKGSSQTKGHTSQEKAATRKRSKALVLLSGGLDSMLATKLTADQGVEVEAVNFVNPFSTQDEKTVERFCQDLGIRLHKVTLGEEFLDMIVNPRHGYGSQMNPCVDCRILTLKMAKRLTEKIQADFLVTGEVLDERPFSQRKDSMLLIEREADLHGKILRPLSAKLLPETDPEKKGLVNREELLAVRGRRRLPQMELAKKLGIIQYPSPSGGCLLTEPRFAERLKEHLRREKKLCLMDAELLRIGRHFRVSETKVVVGRNREENERLLLMSVKRRLASMEVMGYLGPLTLLVGKVDSETLMKAAAITARYSDAPKKKAVKVRYKGTEGEQVLETESIEDEQLKHLGI